MERYKSIYSEEAISGSAIAMDDKFCLLVKKSDSTEIVLYDKTLINNPSEMYSSNEPAIYCFGEMETSSANPYECWSVVMSAALNKFGPFLYDTMLSIAGEKGLIPDRGSVSDQARNIWEYYFTRRQNQFRLVKIDNFKNPETKDQSDDGWVHNVSKRYADRDLIDYIYYYKNYKPHLKIIKKLKDNHINFIKESGFDKIYLEVSLIRASSQFFSTHYNE